MLKHSTQPLQFPRTMRSDNISYLGSCRAGETHPIAAIPLFRDDSATGRVTLSAQLAEMPKPLENAVIGRLQTWFVPRPSFPQFSGLDEYTHAYQGKDISQLGAVDRSPPSLFSTVGTGAITAFENSEFMRALGISLKDTTEINTDYVDAYVLIHNFRLAAHSSKMTRADYYSEDATASLQLKPAFWPRNKNHEVVADYESALVVGSLDLDVLAGTINLTGDGQIQNLQRANSTTSGVGAIPGGSGGSGGRAATMSASASAADMPKVDLAAIFGDMSGETFTTSLANIDMARKQQAFAKQVASMDGNQFSGFNNDDVLILELMNGFTVDESLLNRPWLIESKTGVFGMSERHATDAANLEDSVTIGDLGLSCAINVPANKYGGIIMALFEFMPERLYERQSDEYLYVTQESDLPNALRDSLNPEPVEIVTNGEIDTKHATVSGTFGYRELNGKWSRERTILGGNFRQLTPGTPSTTARTAIWQVDYVDPVLTADHWLCAHPFPQDVFSVPADDTCILSARVDITIQGKTQFGNRLVEDNSDFAAVSLEGET